MKKKIKILWYGDFCSWTGFSTLNENLVKRLMDEFDITVFATNYFGEPHDWPLKVIPAIKFASEEPEYQDNNGQRKLIDTIIEESTKEDGGFDILYTNKDAINMADNNFGKNIKQLQKLLQDSGRKVFKWVFYAAIDSEPRQHWIDESLSLCDVPVLYTKWAQKEVAKFSPKLKTEVIYHGVNTEDFYPLSRQVSRKLKRDLEKQLNKEDIFLVTNVNRNIARKDIPRTILAFKEFKKKVPNAVLYLHMRYQDFGGDFRLMAQEVGLKGGEDIIWPEMDEYSMPTRAQMNEVYNMSDMIISTSCGEGWGFSITESMATRTPIVMPNHTSITEIVGDKEERGYLVPSGSDQNLWMNRGNEYFNIWCPMVDVYKMADKMYECYKNKKETKKKVDMAYDWAKNITWDSIAKEWSKLLNEMVG